jgi:hypothetical protein
MTLLSIANSVAIKVLKQTVTAAVGTNEPNVAQLIELINEEGQEQAAKYTWQVLCNEGSVTTVAAESQGLMTTLAGADFQFIVNETMWNRSQRRPVPGPIKDAEWQALKATFITGPWIQYRVRGNQLLFIPIPAAGQSVYYEWQSKYWCTDATGVTGKSAMTADTDISKLDERLLILGTIVRFKSANKLDYSADQEKYDAAIADAQTRDGSKPRLTLGGGAKDIFPGTFVQSGNFTL